MRTLQDLTKLVITFRDERDWKQFHNPKDVGLSLALEVAEVIEHFQWRNAKEIEEHLDGGGREALGEELSDVLYFLLVLAHDQEIDLERAFLDKIKKNAEKYPVGKAKGSNKKYTELQRT